MLFFNHYLFSVPGIIGCLQALEAIKIASVVGEPLSGRMLLFDALAARIRIVCFMFYTFKSLFQLLMFLHINFSDIRVTLL